MSLSVTFTTKRNNIKPVLGGIAFVVVLLSVFTAIVAVEARCFRQVAVFDGVAYGRTGGTFCCIFLSTTCLCCFAFFCLRVFAASGICSQFMLRFLAIGSLANLCLRRFCISSFANLTMIVSSILSCMVPSELRQQLDSLAFRAGLLYSGIKHVNLLFRLPCLGPVASDKLPSGPFILTAAHRTSIKFMPGEILQ